MTEVGQTASEIVLRPWDLLSAVSGLSVGPMAVIFIVSFPGLNGGMSFPMVGFSILWFQQLFSGNGRVGDILFLSSTSRSRLLTHSCADICAGSSSARSGSSASASSV
jgi:hypothetical protein